MALRLFRRWYPSNAKRDVPGHNGRLCEEDGDVRGAPQTTKQLTEHSPMQPRHCDEAYD